MDIPSLLRKTPFFRGISPVGIGELANICIPKSVAKREILFLEGQEGHSVYLLAAGVVQLFKTSQDGREIVIKTLNPGEIFAEVILFEEKQYPVSAMALQKCLVLLLPKLQLHCLLENQNFRADFIGMLLRKQRYLTQRIFYLTTQDIEDRFFVFLLEQYGKQQEYRISISKKDIAAAIGTIPETLSRLLNRLKNQGTLTWQGGLLSLRKGFWEERDYE